MHGPSVRVEVHVLPVQLVVDQGDPLQVGHLFHNLVEVCHGEGSAGDMRLSTVPAPGTGPLEAQHPHVGQCRVAVIRNQ